MKENAFYQRMIQSLRDLNTRGEWRWPAKGDAAVTKYPNIAAEIEAFSGYLWCPAQHAGVSKEILVAVLEDDEELSTREMLGLTRLFECGYGYLSAPTLQLIDPATNKGKARRRLLADMFSHYISTMDIYETLRVRQVLKDMEAGKLVTYAAWRKAYQLIEEAAAKAWTPAIRTVRRAAV